MPKRILIKYCGHLPRVVNKEEEWIQSESELSIDELLAKLSGQYRGLQGSSLLDSRHAYLITVNGEFLPSSGSDGLLIKDGDVISLFPPVCGG